MRTDFIALKCILCILGIIFIVSCTIDLIYTIKEIVPRSTIRSLEINMGYQVIFLVGTMPVVVGIFFESREPLVHFLILAPYSTIVDTVWLVFLSTDHVQLIYLKKWWVIGFLYWKIALTVCCTIVTIKLLRRVIVHKKQEEKELDFEKTYAFRRFGGDSIIYGYHCGPSEVFYHESAGTTAGLPPPADPMGLVQLKAKRRLERDHAIILL